MVGYYNYTVILTYASLAFAIVGITFSFKGNIQGAMICLMGSGLCDMFDGTVARLRKRTEDEIAFGAHIDSLCDLVAFGVQPAIVLFAYGEINVWFIIVAVFYALAAVSRLAYFDVQEMHKIDNGEKRKYFTGLPVTNAALIIPGLQLFNLIFKINRPYYYLASLLIVGILFITPFKMKKAYMPWLIFWAAFGIAMFVLVAIFGGNF